MNMLQFIVAAAVAGGLAFLLVRQYNRESARRADQGRVLYAPVYGLLDDPELKRELTAGVWTLTGHYLSYPFQLKTIADTLATRKLPSLWLMITLPEPQPVSATTNMMMRAAGVTSFSNFDFLPHTLALPEGFPEQATIKSDAPKSDVVVSLMARHLKFFRHEKGKEFLISPKGLRIVLQIAEGNRARYGVFREANFEGAYLDPEFTKQVMNTLINLRNDIHSYVKN